MGHSQNWVMATHFMISPPRRVSLALSFLLVVSASPQPRFGWVRDNHEVVALVAERYVSESAKPKGSDNSTSRRQNVQEKTENKQTPSVPTPLPDTPEAKKYKDRSGNPDTTDALKSVVIREPVTVSAPTSWWERFYVIFIGFLVAVGGIGAYLAMRTLRAIEEQARAAKSGAETAKENALAAKASADAAALNAQAVIDSERAWVLVKSVGNPEAWYDPTKPDYLPGMVFEFEVCGKTPARVMNAIFHLDNVPAKFGLKPPEPDLPAIPNYRSAGRSPEFPEGGRIMPTGQKFQIRLGLVQQMTEREWLKLRDGETVMCAFGIIEYEDSFGRKRETRTCYVYNFAWGGVIKSPDGTVLNPPSFRIGGPPAYNQAT